MAGDDFGNGLPFDFSSILDGFKENIEISKDREGVIIRFKKMVPGMNLEQLKNSMEGFMNMRNVNPSKLMKSMFGKANDDEDDMEDEDEDADDEEQYGPGFTIETLESDDGFKLIPNDPAEIDDLYDSLSQMFNPEFFKQMMQAAMQMFGGIFKGLGNPDAPDDEEPDDDEDAVDAPRKKGPTPPSGDNPFKGKKRKDSNMAGDYFYT
jgi:hypothetical protein